MEMPIPSYYVSQKSRSTGKIQSTEVELSTFPPGLTNRRPDHEDTASTKMCGYAMSMVGLSFQTELLAGGVLYTIISDEWRVKSWLAEPEVK